MNELRQLNTAYAKRFKHLNKELLTTNTSGLNIFVEHLKYLRDRHIITQKSLEGISTLNAAIEEFDAYAKSKKEFHWNNFCEFVKQNMEEWLEINDSV